MRWQNKKQKKLQGFSLMEVIVSIAVLTIGLLAVMGLYSDSLQRILTIRYETTAGALAQEGVELVRNAFDSGDTFSGGSNYRVYIDASGDVKVGSGDNKLLYDGNSSSYDVGYYTHGGGEGTRFVRVVTITADDLDGGAAVNDFVVRSFVSWDGSNPNIFDCTTAKKCVMATMDLITP